MSDFTPRAAVSGTWSFGPLASGDVYAVGAYQSPYNLDFRNLVAGAGIHIWASPNTSGTNWTDLGAVVADGTQSITGPWQRLKVVIGAGGSADIYLVVNSF